jgi:hypothetical protein
MGKNIQYKEKYIHIIMIIHDSTLIMHLISVINLNLNIKFWKQNKENRNNNKIKKCKPDLPAPFYPHPRLWPIWPITVRRLLSSHPRTICHCGVGPARQPHSLLSRGVASVWARLARLFFLHALRASPTTWPIKMPYNLKISIFCRI